MPAAHIGEIDPDFHKDLLRYKLMLREIVRELNLGIKDIASHTSVGDLSVRTYISLPLFGGNVHYKAIPSEDTHNEMVAYFRSKGSISEKINELDRFFYEHVKPVVEDRKPETHRRRLLQRMRGYESGQLEGLYPQTPEACAFLKAMTESTKTALEVFESPYYSYPRIVDILDNPAKYREQTVDWVRSAIERHFGLESVGWSLGLHDGRKAIGRAA